MAHRACVEFHDRQISINKKIESVGMLKISAPDEASDDGLE